PHVRRHPLPYRLPPLSAVATKRDRARHDPARKTGLPRSGADLSRVLRHAGRVDLGRAAQTAVVDSLATNHPTWNPRRPLLRERAAWKLPRVSRADLARETSGPGDRNRETGRHEAEDRGQGRPGGPAIHGAGDTAVAGSSADRV